MVDQVGRVLGLRQRLAHACKWTGLLPVLSSLRTLLRRDLRILAYHRVLDDSRLAGFEFDPELISATATDFAWQMRAVAEHSNPVRFSDVVAHIEGHRRLPERAVLVTFDDGYDDNYHVAFPILHALGVPATFFVSTGHIDSGMPYEYDWLVHMVRKAPQGAVAVPELGIDIDVPGPDAGRLEVAHDMLDRIKALPAMEQSALVRRLAGEWKMPARMHPQCRPMTWEQLREMDAAGMEIGSHGVHHRMLTKLPRAEMARELEASAIKLAAELGHRALAIAYPVGGPSAFDDGVIEAARASGFKVGCSYIAGASPADERNRFELRRIPVEMAIDRHWFEAMLVLPELFLHPTPPLRG